MLAEAKAEADKTTGKYYASSEKSTVNRTPVDGGTSRAVQPTQHQEDKSADKYYAEGGSDRHRLARERSQAADALYSPANARPVTGTVTDVQDLVARLGVNERVTIVVPYGDTAAMNKWRAGVDAAVTRQAITEDQAQLASLKFGPPPAAIPPVPETTVKVEDGDPLDDIDAFIQGKPIDPDEVPAAVDAVTPTVVAGDETPAGTEETDADDEAD